MKKFAISVAALVSVAALAVLILRVTDCQKPSPDPIPDAAITAFPSTTPVPAEDASAAPNVHALVLSAESGSVKSDPDGKYLLTLSDVKDFVKSEDGSRTMSLNNYVTLIFAGSKMAVGMLDYDGSRGPVEVRLFSPVTTLADGGPITMLYKMETVGGKQILAKFEKVTLRVKPLP